MRRMIIKRSCFNIHRLYAMFANDMPGSSAVSACLAGLSFPAYEVIPRCEGHSVAASAVPAVGCKAWASAESSEAFATTPRGVLQTFPFNPARAAFTCSPCLHSSGSLLTYMEYPRVWSSPPSHHHPVTITPSVVGYVQHPGASPRELPHL